MKDMKNDMLGWLRGMGIRGWVSGAADSDFIRCDVRKCRNPDKNYSDGRSGGEGM